MRVDEILILSNGRKIVSGSSKWEDNISHRPDDILTDGVKQWKVRDVERIHQGCFGAPITRLHGLILEPIDHTELPQEGDTLTKLA